MTTPKSGRKHSSSVPHSPKAHVVSTFSMGEVSPQLSVTPSESLTRSPSLAHEHLLSTLGQSLQASVQIPLSPAESRTRSPSAAHSQADLFCGRGQTLRVKQDSSVRSLSRTRSEGLLVGVSSTAEYLNSKQNRSLHKLVQGNMRGRKFQASNRSDHSSLPPGWRGTELDEQDFIRNTDRLVNSILDLRSRHEAFEAMGSPLSRRRRSSVGGYGAKDASEQASTEEQEKAERLAERLEAYKLVRRVEGDVPQLPPLSSLPALRKEHHDDTIIKKNCSSTTIQCYAPDKRKELIANRSTALCERTNLAATMREESLTSMRTVFSESLQRKKMQGDRIAQAKQEVAVRKSVALQDVRNGFEREWFKIVILATSIKHLAEEVKVGRMPPEERMRYMEKLRLSRTGGSCGKLRKVSAFVQQAMFLSDVMADEMKCWRLGLVASMVRSRMQIQECRSNARAVFECLSSWQVAGRCFTAFKALYNRVIVLQRWWRETSKRLHEIRDQIARRWERLERVVLVQELNRSSSVHTRPSKNASGQPKLTFEDRIESERVEESVRTRFIENELRVRRYKMLPQILMWEEEVERWRVSYQEWQDTKDAHRALGKEVPAMTIFHWPPVRPSYLPKAHPLTEANGHPCHECCLGRQGDEEILNMWRAARRNPGLTSLTPMPTGSGGLRPKGRRTGARTSVAEFHTERTASPFGEAADEELQTWGVSAATMPGLTADAEGESSGAPAPAIAPPC